MLTLYSIKDINLNNFKIIEHITKTNTSVYNVKYDNSNFLIEPKIAFTNCSYFFSNKINKIRININYSNYDENGINMLLTKIYSGVNKCIFKNINLKSLKLITPIHDSEILEKVKVFYLHINKNTLLQDFETKEIITPDDLKYKRFDIFQLFILHL